MALAALVASGCRTPHGLQDLERELRYQEDMIYELQDYIGTYKSHLNDCRKENERLRREAGENGSGGGQSGGGRLRELEDIVPPEDGLAPPVIELPELDGAEDGEFNDASGPSIDAAQNPIASHRDYARAEFPEDGRIAALSLDESSTRASRSRGVEIVLEPQNAAGQIVPAAGELSVAILDPAAATAEEARVARWQFTAEQTRLLAHEARPGEGLRLELVWPDGPPRRSNLRMFVRLVTPQGRRFVAEQGLQVDTRQLQAVAPQSTQSAAQKSSPAWTARTRPRPSITPEVNSPPIIPLHRTELAAPTARQGASPRRPDRAARRPQWSPYR